MYHRPLDWVLCLATSVTVALLVQFKRRSLQAFTGAALSLMFLSVGQHNAWILFASAAAILALVVFSAPWRR